MKKSRPPAEAESADDSRFSPFSCLPDEVVLEIFKKIIDLKTLCVCEFVSKRFYAIVHQVDTICYTTQLILPLNIENLVSKFKKVKSFCIRIPSNYYNNYDDDVDYSDVLFKWKVKLGKNKIDSFVIVLPTSIYDNNNGMLLYGEEEKCKSMLYARMFKYRFRDAVMRFYMLWHITQYFTLLEKVSIIDMDNSGRVSVNGRENIDELRNCNDVDCPELPDRFFVCYVRLLALPVSGYVMKKVFLVLAESNDISDDGNGKYERFMNDEIDFKHDKEEAAYHEAMMEIFKKHRGSFWRAR